MHLLKNQLSENLKRLLLPLTFLLCCLMLSSCKKENTESTTLASLIVVNASPTLATYNVYVDGTKLINAALPFGGSIAYKQFTAAEHTVKFTSETENTALLTKTISLENSKAYSYFLIDKSDKMDGLLVSDTPESYAADKAFVRFINLSPDAPALNLALNESNSNFIADQSYKQVSGFITIDPGTYTFNAKDKALDAVKATLSNVKLEAGIYYTIMCTGLLSPGNIEEPITLQIYTHK